jgi:hypothetical protein
MVKPVLPPPPDGANLWRYMNFTKFVSIMCSKSLYFSRADSFPDKFEGAKGAAILEKKYNEFYLNFLRKICSTVPGAKPEDLTTETIEESARKALDSLRKAGEWSRKTTFINCWHEAQHESEAMWRLYAGWQASGLDNPGSIVVITTFGKLVKSLSSLQNVYVGRVNYIDWSF